MLGGNDSPNRRKFLSNQKVANPNYLESKWRGSNNTEKEEPRIQIGREN